MASTGVRDLPGDSHQWLITSRACLSGWPETRITPSKGLLRSRITWMPPPRQEHKETELPLPSR